MKFIITCMITLLLSVGLHGVAYEEVVESIEEHAVVIGEGNNRIYAFIDPLCPKSQNYLSVIAENASLQEINTYYIFLYRLQKYDSDALIEYIYDAADVPEMLKLVMTGGYKPKLGYFAASPSAKARKKAISDAADIFGAKRRPYILLFKEGSNYCRVSEGTAPCLEEK